VNTVREGFKKCSCSIVLDYIYLIYYMKFLWYRHYRFGIKRKWGHACCIRKSISNSEKL